MDKIYTDVDFINAPRYQNSLKKLLEKKPNGVQPAVAAKMLNLAVSDLQKIHAKALKKLKKSL